MDAKVVMLEELLNFGLINQEVFEKTKEKLLSPEFSQKSCGSQGELLYWMQQEKLLDNADIEIMRVKAKEPTAQGENAIRVMLDFDRADKEIGKAVSTWIRRGLSIAVGVPVLIIAAVMLFNYWQKSRPLACDDSRVVSLISGGAKIKYISRQIRMGAKPAGNRVNAFNVKVSKELGYVKNEKTTGCIGKLVTDDEAIDIAYEVSRDDTNFYVHPASEEYLREKYKRLNADGALPVYASPTGEGDLKAVIVKEVERFDESSNQPLVGQHRDNASVVRDVLLKNDCFQQGDHWTCDVLFDYRDPMLSLLNGGGWNVVNAKLDFVKKGNKLSAATGFKEQLVKAMVAGRISGMTAKPEVKSE